MRYANILVQLLRAPEFAGSAPVARATWLSVLGYSVEQENGGRIVGAAKWTERQWVQACGVTLREIRKAAPLLILDGDDLVVWSYPEDQERVMKSKREVARLNGQAGGRPKSNPIMKPAREPISEPTSESVIGNVIGNGIQSSAEPAAPPLAGEGGKAIAFPAPHQKPQSSRPRDSLFDTLAEVTEAVPPGGTAPNGGKIAKALSIIKSICPTVTPEEIVRRANAYSEAMPTGSAISSTALASNWHRCDGNHRLFQRQNGRQPGIRMR